MSLLGPSAWQTAHLGKNSTRYLEFIIVFSLEGPTFTSCEGLKRGMDTGEDLRDRGAVGLVVGSQPHRQRSTPRNPRPDGPFSALRFVCQQCANCAKRSEPEKY